MKKTIIVKSKEIERNIFTKSTRPEMVAYRHCFIWYMLNFENNFNKLNILHYLGFNTETAIINAKKYFNDIIPDSLEDLRNKRILKLMSENVVVITDNNTFPITIKRKINTKCKLNHKNYLK